VRGVREGWLREEVHAALDAAAENGYEFLRTWPAGPLAEDLRRFAGGLERVPVDEVLPHVESWLDAHPCS
jgi:hypothetical protein